MTPTQIILFYKHFGVSTAVVVGVGPFCFAAVQTFSGGASAVELHSGGAVETELHSGGAKAAQVDCQ